MYTSPNTSLYEKATLNRMRFDCLNATEEFNVFYLHSKGVKHYLKQKTENNVNDWIEYLCHYNIFHHQTCIKYLEDYDAVGVNLQIKEYEYPLHYSGNFWWSKSSHIKKLSIINDINFNYN